MSAGFEPAPGEGKGGWWDSTVSNDRFQQSFQATGGHHRLTTGPYVVKVYPSLEANNADESK